jgi:peptidoglycan/LPS O-acetylase OafA/YrhL
MNTALRYQDTSNSQNTLLPDNYTIDENKTKNKIPVLDGLRAIACLGVLSFHVSFIAGGRGIWTSLHDTHDIPGMLAYLAGTLAYAGYAGVILFFLLSGFLLFLPYAKALLFESSWPGLRRFYLRRIFRILPGYYAVLFLLILFFHPEFLNASHRHALWLFLTFTMSQRLANTLNGVFWSLGVEFQFYLLLPIFAWLFSLIVRRGTLRRRMLKLTLCLLLMTAWGLLTRYWGLFLANTPKLDFLIPHPVSLALIPYLYSDTGKFFPPVK